MGEDEFEGLIAIEVVLETVDILFFFDGSKLPFPNTRKDDALLGNAERVADRLGIAPDGPI
jgi:hypothetical protein